MTLFTKEFWADAAERALATGAQSALAVIGLDAGGVIVAQLDLKTVGLAFVIGAGLALVKAIAAIGTGTRGTASFVDTNTYK